MSITSVANPWFKSHYGNVSGPVCASKFYKPEESWTKRRVWWFEIPLQTIKENPGTKLHLLCQVAPDKEGFHYLKVPAVYFMQHLNKLSIRDNGKLSLFLSAEPNNMFVDERGSGRIQFSQFLV